MPSGPHSQEPVNPLPSKGYVSEACHESKGSLVGANPRVLVSPVTLWR